MAEREALAGYFASMCAHDVDEPHTCNVLIAAHDVAQIIRDSRIALPVEHCLKGTACSCGRWEAKLGESIQRGFDRHVRDS